MPDSHGIIIENNERDIWKPPEKIAIVILMLEKK